jgi:hypothetical protein
MPAVTTVNLSSLVAPTAAPQTLQPASLTVADMTAAVPGASKTGTIAVPAAAKHTLTITLTSPIAVNTVTINGTVPSGWSALAPGLIASVVVDVPGIWVLQVTTAGVAADPVTIEGY